MDYFNNTEGQQYNLNFLKEGVDCKRKLTAKSHTAEVSSGELYPPSGSNIFSMQGSLTFYFTGGLR